MRQVIDDLVLTLEGIGEVYRFETALGAHAQDGARAQVERICDECSVVVGLSSVLLPIMRQRHLCGRQFPCLVLALGALPRGALHFRELLPYLTEADVVVVSSEADRRLARAFFPNVTTAVVPLSIRQGTFRPLEAAERLAQREACGLKATSELLLYAGRLTLEKNIHTLLRVFAAVAPQMRDPYLYLAGTFSDIPFQEMGVVPLGYARTLGRICARLGIPAERVVYLGPLDSTSLVQAYGSADVLVNLTLHHDENFGLAQVEALACGTPVVGTGWGGLHDTIKNGITGRKVPVVVTPIGLKVDWWHAASDLLEVLGGAGQGSRRVELEDVPVERYAFSSCAELWQELVATVCRSPVVAPKPVQASAFARAFWQESTSPGDTHARYRIGTRSFELYCELVTHYVESEKRRPPPIRDCADSQVVVLPVPLSVTKVGRILVDDPLYPTRVDIPSSLRVSVTRLLAACGRRQAATLGGLRRRWGPDDRDLFRGLEWMTASGLMLVSQRTAAGLPLDRIPSALHQRLFTVRTCDRRQADILAFRD